MTARGLRVAAVVAAGVVPGAVAGFAVAATEAGARQHGASPDLPPPQRGLCFVQPGSAAPFTEGAVIGLHGSWNRHPPLGHKVIFLPSVNGRPVLFSSLIGAVASARFMTPMATLSAARLAGRRTQTAPDRTVFSGLLARVLSAGIAGAALAPRGRERAGAVLAVATAVPLACLTLSCRKQAIARIGQTRSGLIEDLLILAAGAAVVALAGHQG